MTALTLSALLGLSTGLAASRPRPKSVPAGALIISDSSLTQDGQQLAWRLQTTTPFSPRALAGQQRSICLLIDRPKSLVLIGRLCVAGGRRSPRLLYQRQTKGGPARAISATVTRSSRSELTASFLPSALGLGYRPLRWLAISLSTGGQCKGSAAGSPPCSSQFPARPRLLSLHTPKLVGCRPSGSSEVFQGPSSRHEIALTFDDGPGPTPPASDFIRLLAKDHVPATFFEIGDQIPEYDDSGSAERSMLADGDMIGNHTWTHPDMTRLSASAQRSQLEQTNHAIEKRTGFTPCLWRPPYGSVNPRLVSFARSLGMLTVMWDVDPRDWSLPGTQAIYERVVSAAHNGAIVIQHFGGGPRYETLAALPKEIRTLRARGYRFVTVASLLGLKLIYR